MSEHSTPPRRGTNHLANEKSPYLQQHAHNPVDWYPWGEAAFARAKAEDKPIFLSIGYSTCHWCHVMAHESFENDSIAAIMNDLFVNIKVDREERPDVDALYMRAVQAMTRQGGGWPLSVFLTPDLVPFFGGTYFPPEDRFGRPGFPSLLRQIAEAYRTRRGEIEQAGAQLTAFLKSGPEPGDEVPPESLIVAACRQNRSSFDPAWGGFGDAPKFPRSMTLSFLLRYHHRHPDPETLTMVTRTLDAMAAGGIHDQLGGGFHRYATDERWLVPHFEKMLYDNALLARAYLEAYQVTGEARYAAIARDIFAYLMRDLRAPGGGFYSAEDADSEGEEGKFYVWSSREIDELLGDDAPLFSQVYDVTAAGNFEGHNILWTPRPLDQIARELKIDPADLEARLAKDRERLFEARKGRVRPHRDEKILTSWNALALGAFALGYRVLGDALYLEAAKGIARFLTEAMWDGRTLRARWAQGEVRYDGCLDDYAFLAWGLMELYESTFDPADLRLAFAVLDRAEAEFATPEGGYYLAPSTHGELIARPQEVYDGALPSGNSVMVQNLLSRSEYTGDLKYRERAELVLRVYRTELEAHPASYPQMLSALDFRYAGPREVVIAGDRSEAVPLIEALWGTFEPNKVVLLAVPGDEGLDDLTAIISGKSAGRNGALAYVCRDFTCKLPTSDPQEMLELLR